MKTSLFVAFLLAATAYSLPNFVPALEERFSEGKFNCRTCHTFKVPEAPNNRNVSEEGIRLYTTLLTTPFDPDATRKVVEKFPVSTADEAGFLIYGDSRTQAHIHKKLAKLMCAEPAKTVIHTGDMVEDGRVMAQWDEATEISRCLWEQKAFHPSCGNHEGDFCLKNPFRKALKNSKRFYTADWEGYTFIALDSHHNDEEQLKWLQALPAGRKYIPFYHHVPYPTIFGHRSDPGVTKNFLPVFKKLGVKLAFNGHNHAYDRAEVDGVSYVNVGGGGAPLYPCGKPKPYTKACNAKYSYARCRLHQGILYCSVHDLDGAEMDRFSVKY